MRPRADTSSQEDSDLEKTSLFAHVGTFRSAFLAPVLEEVRLYAAPVVAFSDDDDDDALVCSRAASQAGSGGAKLGMVEVWSLLPRLAPWRKLARMRPQRCA
jgi:hypothetical protein